jgi:hypothetical protein
MATSAAADLLQRWIDTDCFEPNIDRGLDEFRYPSGFNKTNWYTKIVTRDGADEAERRLAEWMMRMHLQRTSRSIRDVAAGMLYLVSHTASSRPRNEVVAQVVDSTGDSTFPGMVDAAETAKMVVVYNPRIPECPCPLPDHADVFGAEAPLGLRVVTLSHHPEDSWRDCLCLVLDRSSSDGPGAYSIATFNLAGILTSRRVVPYFSAVGPLQVALGQGEGKLAWMTTVINSSESTDHALWPGCSDLLRNQVPHLGRYFGALAGRLSSHSH